MSKLAVFSHVSLITVEMEGPGAHYVLGRCANLDLPRKLDVYAVHDWHK